MSDVLGRAGPFAERATIAYTAEKAAMYTQTGKDFIVSRSPAIPKLMGCLQSFWVWAVGG